MYKNKRKFKQKLNKPNSHMLDDKLNLLLRCPKTWISIKIDNTIRKLLAQNENINQNKFNKCGVYQLTRHDCNRKYIGQTGKPCCVGFQEHFQNF